MTLSNNTFKSLRISRESKIANRIKFAKTKGRILIKNNSTKVTFPIIPNNIAFYVVNPLPKGLFYYPLKSNFNVR